MSDFSVFPRGSGRRAAVGDHVLAGRARLRADLQGLGGVQLRARRDGVLRGADVCRLHGARAAVLGGAAGHRRRDGAGRLVHRALRAAAAGEPREDTLFMATLGLGFVIEGLAQLVWGVDVHASISASATSRSTGDGPDRHADQPARRHGAAVAGVMVVSLALLFSRTRSGAACARWPTIMPRRCRSASR